MENLISEPFGSAVKSCKKDSAFVLILRGNTTKTRPHSVTYTQANINSLIGCASEKSPADESKLNVAEL